MNATEPSITGATPPSNPDPTASRPRAWWEPLAKAARQQPPSYAALRKLIARDRERRIVAVPKHDTDNPHKIVTIGGTDYTVGHAGNLIRVHSRPRSKKS